MLLPFDANPPKGEGDKGKAKTTVPVLTYCPSRCTIGVVQRAKLPEGPHRLEVVLMAAMLRRPSNESPRQLDFDDSAVNPGALALWRIPEQRVCTKVGIRRLEMLLRDAIPSAAIQEDDLKEAAENLVELKGQYELLRNVERAVNSGSDHHNEEK